MGDNHKTKNFDSRIEETLKNNGYINYDNALIKSFPLPFPYKEKIIENYKRYAQSAFYEEAGLNQMKWQEGLDKLAYIAEKESIVWWTTGKILLPLNGVKADIDDVDFYFYEKDLKAVYNAFQEYIIEPIICGGSRSDSFKYNGQAYIYCTVCMLAEPTDIESLDIPEPVHFGQYAMKNLKVFNWNGHKIKAPPIELYIRTLERWGKMEQAEYIKNALLKKSRNC